MLAHMIGDGSCIKRQPVRYASIDEANIAAVTIAAAHFGITPIRDEYAAARVTISHQGGRARSPGDQVPGSCGSDCRTGAPAWHGHDSGRDLGLREGSSCRT